MDDDFEELTCEGELLSGSSQESLTGAATNLSFAEDVEQNSLYHTFQIPEEYEYAPANLPRALAEEEGVNFAVTPTSDVSSRGLRSYPKYSSWCGQACYPTDRQQCGCDRQDRRRV